MIYVIGRADEDWRWYPVKIGTSKVPSNRLTDLQVGHPYKLKIISTAEGGTKEEKDYHTALSPARLTGEWFDPAKMTPEAVKALSEGRFNFLLTEKNCEMTKEFPPIVLHQKKKRPSIWEGGSPYPEKLGLSISPTEIAHVMEVYSRMGYTVEPDKPQQPAQLSLLQPH